MVEGEGGHQGVEVFHEVAENRDLVFLLNEADGGRQQFLADFVVVDALVHQGETECKQGYNLTLVVMLSLDLMTRSTMLFCSSAGRREAKKTSRA